MPAVRPLALLLLLAHWLGCAAGTSSLASKVQQLHDKGWERRISLLDDTLLERRRTMVKNSISNWVNAGYVWLQHQQQPSILSQSKEKSDALRVVECINQQYVPTAVEWKRAMADEISGVKVVGSWQSQKARTVPLTVVTQSTVNRVPQLYAQCKSWPGPLSVVLHLGLVQSSIAGINPHNQELVDQAMLQVSNFFYEVEGDSRSCAPDILLVIELYQDQETTQLYPINILRNLARLQARTPLVAFLDVDMLLGGTLYQDMQQPEVQKNMLQLADNRAVYVLPAFETYGPTTEAAALADALAAQNKDSLIAAVKKGVAAPFDSKRFTPGHNSTNFKKWYGASAPYIIAYGARFEPWVIASRLHVPWHDARYRGYGNNKIQQIAHMNATRIKFVVHHSAFIIHRAHAETRVRHNLVQSKVEYDNALARGQPVNTTSVYGHTRWLLDQEQKQLVRGTFRTVIDDATLSCRAALPWWSDSQVWGDEGGVIQQLSTVQPITTTADAHRSSNRKAAQKSSVRRRMF